MSQNVLLCLDESCTPSHAVLWCEMAVAEPHHESSLMIYSVCTCVRLPVYLTGLISLVAYFLFIANISGGDKCLAPGMQTFVCLSELHCIEGAKCARCVFIGIAPP